jgi:pimeloyl-ACP methyl ester carboxylesterase
MSDTAITPTAPEWFTKALACQPESHFVDVDGTPIHYLAWNANDTHKPGLVLAHGFRAHARWWSFVAPFFLSRFRVVAFDWAGMGDSGNRPEYNSALFSRDLLGVIEHAQLGKATLVGHSFGGGRVMRFCAEHAEHVERAVVVDSYILLDGLQRHTPPPMQLRPKNIYPTYAAARERFRLVPEHTCATPYVIDYVARHSIKEVDGGWTWKFDDAHLPRLLDTDTTGEAILAGIALPLTFVYGDLSAIVNRAEAHAIVKHIPHGRGPIAIPQSHHHVMLDQPLSLVAALKAILY